MRIKILLLLIIGILFTSCSTVAYLKTDDLIQTYSATNPKQIEIYSTDKVDKIYSVIGKVVASADAGKDATIPVNLLKKEAAKLGADAIISVILEIDYGNWSNAIKATGTAVKFK